MKKIRIEVLKSRFKVGGEFMFALSLDGERIDGGDFGPWNTVHSFYADPFRVLNLAEAFIHKEIENVETLPKL